MGCASACSRRRRSTWRTCSCTSRRALRTERRKLERPRIPRRRPGDRDGHPGTIMRILVTGGAGYIGSHAVRLFLERGHDVTVYDSLVFGHRAAVPAERLIVADLADSHRLDQVFVEKRFDGIVHFAAFAYVGESVTHPAKYYQNNVVNTLGLLECVRKHRVPRFVFSSTCATYGMPDKMPITEETPQRPINPYGQGKLIVEMALADYARAYQLGFAALR